MNAFKTILLLAALVPGLCAQSQTDADKGTVFRAPDNGVGNNETELLTKNETRKEQTLYIKIEGHPKDEVFTLEIVDDLGKVTEVEFSAGNAPAVTIPVGSTARIRDDQDSNTVGPRGRWWVD